MAVVPYYNRKGYNELSKKAEAALGNIPIGSCYSSQVDPITKDLKLF